MKLYNELISAAGFILGIGLVVWRFVFVKLFWEKKQGKDRKKMIDDMGWIRVIIGFAGLGLLMLVIIEPLLAELFKD